MKDLRVEITDDGQALYVAIDPDGRWAKTTQLDDLVTIDWDHQGRAIGIEAIGSAAHGVAQMLLRSIGDLAQGHDDLRRALGDVVGIASFGESDVDGNVTAASKDE